MKKEIQIQYDFFKDAGQLDATGQMLFDKAKAVRENAYAPYSRFLVGCAMLLEMARWLQAAIRKMRHFLRVHAQSALPSFGVRQIFPVSKLKNSLWWAGQRMLRKNLFPHRHAVPAGRVSWNMKACRIPA